MSEGKSLEILLKSSAALAIQKFDELIGRVKEFDSVVTKTSKKFDANGNLLGMTEVSKSYDGLITKVTQYNDRNEKVSETIKETTKDSYSLRNALSAAFDLNKLYLFWNLTKRLRDGLKEIVLSAIDYNETQNKFNMSMGTAKPEAVLFINKVDEAVGIGKAALKDYQSVYKNIIGGLGNFTHQQSERISESLVKMALDYSSLFNVSRDSSMSKFQGALTGSIRPIRSDSGYDISDKTLSSKLQELGVTQSISQLNQMEKRILRIIVLMDQLKNTGAMGDLARTIEQPANQLQVLKQQIQEVGVWLGNVFMGTISSILPYINGFVMAIKEVIKMFALFVGYTGDNSNLSDVFEDVEDSVVGVGGGIDSANKKAKELKKTLMSFDVLNVINTPTQNNSSGGGGGAGIDPKILNALSDYDSLLEKVHMKATDIRDKIMDWLGFTKQIDPLTGEISWKLRDGYTNLEKILDVAKAIGLAIATWKVSSTIANFMNMAFGLNKKLGLRLATGLTLSITGAFIEYNGISHLVDDGMDAFAILEAGLGAVMTGTGFYTIINAIVKAKHLKFGTGHQIALAASLALMITAVEIGMKAVQTSNLGLMILSAVAMGIGSYAALATLGVSPVISLAIGVALAITTLTVEWSASKAKGIDELKSKIKELKKDIEDTIKSYDDSIKSIKDSADSQLLELDYADELRNKLKAIVDENGKIKAGYEDRAKFILGELNKALGTEYTANGNIIQNYKDMQTEIQGIIAQKKKEIEIEAYSELYKESLKEQIELKKKESELQIKQNELLEEHKKISDNGIFNPTNWVSMQKWNTAWDDCNKAIDENNKALEDSGKSVNFYGDQINNLSTGIQEATGEIITDVTQMSSTTVESMRQLADASDPTEFINNLNVMEESTQASLLAQCTTIDNYKGEIEAKWRDLAVNYKDEFEKAISLVEPATRGVILASLTDVETYSPEVENAWLQLAKDSYVDYERELKEIDTYTAAKIIAAKTNVEGLTDENARAWEYLAERADGSYEAGLATVDNYTDEQIRSAISEVTKNTPTMETEAQNFSEKANTKFKLLDGTSPARLAIEGIISCFTGANLWGVHSFVNSINGILGGIMSHINLNISGSASIGGRAEGGPVSMGELFVAREAGPELVGTIGKTTTVMNNNQIVESVASGVKGAVAEVLTRYNSRGPKQITVPVYIGGDKIQETVHDLENRDNIIKGR